MVSIINESVQKKASIAPCSSYNQPIETSLPAYLPKSTTFPFSNVSTSLLTATTSPNPIFNGEWINPGTHISGVGSHSPNARELDTTTIQRAKVVCDQVSACLVEAGDIMIPIKEGAITKDHLYGELGEIVSGKKRGRETNSEITVFKSVGLAIQDAATAKLVYDKACEQNIGTTAEI